MGREIGLVSGVFLLLLGWFSIIWVILKIISCIVISGYISTRFLGLTGYTWWFSSIVIFSIFAKLLLSGDIGVKYKEFVDSTLDDSDSGSFVDDVSLDYDCSNNAIFTHLQGNYGNHPTRVVFFDGTELIVGKFDNYTCEGDFMVYVDNENPNVYKSSFNINNVKSVETIYD